MFCDAAGRNAMQEIDQYAIEKLGIPSMVLMERAALALSKAVMELAAAKDRVLCICGMGNNGGDGIAVSRILRENGMETSVLMIGDSEKQSKQCRQQMNIARKLSIPVQFFSSDGIYGKEKENILNRILAGEYTIIVDAVFGIGLHRPVEGEFKECIEAVNASGAKVVAADIPSGIDAEDGQVLGCAIKASITVTFGLMKQGLLMAPGYLYAGEVRVEPIGFPRQAVERIRPFMQYYQKEKMPIKKQMEGLLPGRSKESNKGTYGRVLVIAGSPGMAGAALLCAKAAGRMGCGLVRIFSEEGNRSVLQSGFPEAIFTGYAMEEEEKEVRARLDEAISWASSVVIGPGLSKSQRAREILFTVLEKGKDIPLVVDADAINLLAENKALLSGDQTGANIVLTPHLLEMSRLSGCSMEDIRKCRMQMLQKIPFPEGVLVLKDARTMVFSENRCFINTHGSNGMATGGSGDVLSGMLAGILAYDKRSFYESAVSAVVLHAMFGELAAEKWTPHGMLAGDLVEVMGERK